MQIPLIQDAVTQSAGTMQLAPGHATAVKFSSTVSERNASTQAGSNCVPEQRAISARASS